MPPQDMWGPEGPPEEAYSRVTNPERFLPLHDAALEMLAALVQQYDVEHVEGYGLDEELERRGVVRPCVALRPTGAEGAPLTVAFTDFPGLWVRFGRWYTEPFPSCGCDACAEDVDGEIERLAEMVDILTAGGFQEAVVHSPRRWRSGGWFGRGLGHQGSAVARYAPLNEVPRREVRLPWMPSIHRIGGSRLESAFDGPTHRSRGSSLIDDIRALELSGGRRRLDLNWKPWPQI